MTGYRPYDQVQRSLAVCLWVHVTQLACLAALVVLWSCNSSNREFIDKLEELNSTVQGRVSVVEDRVCGMTLLVDRIDSDVQRLDRQAANTNKQKQE